MPSAFSCVSSQGTRGGGGQEERPRSSHSEERELFPSSSTLPQRRQSLPARPARPERKASFHHWGSSLSMDKEVEELTSRTLRPPSPTLVVVPPKHHPNPSIRRRKPSLPDLRVELNHPKLQDYLEKPRFVNNVAVPRKVMPQRTRGMPGSLNPSSYRNLRLGNFFEEEEEEQEGDGIIPERLRLYYLDTYLNVCDTCDSLTHCNPNSPIHKGL
uniref:Uncharacterized protein n=1 Tax=Lepeophtheirus salmonis TaxID=72036 RepID=A0A0K2UMM5_LEPSM